MDITRRADAEARFRSLAAVVVDPVRRYLARRADPSTAEEVLGDVLLVCWRRLDEVPADAPVAWAVGVARHCLANARRSALRRARLDRRIAVADPPPTRTPGPEEAAEVADAADAVTAALARLPGRDAELLRLWAWDKLSTHEIAVVLGIGDGAAAVRLHRAKKKLRREVERERSGPEPDTSAVRGGGTR